MCCRSRPRGRLTRSTKTSRGSTRSRSRGSDPPRLPRLRSREPPSRSRGSSPHRGSELSTAHLLDRRRRVATGEGESRQEKTVSPRGQNGDNLARFRVVGGCPPTTIHPIKMGLAALCCPGRFGDERLITQRSGVQIPPPQFQPQQERRAKLRGSLRYTALLRQSRNHLSVWRPVFSAAAITRPSRARVARRFAVLHMRDRPRAASVPVAG